MRVFFAGLLKAATGRLNLCVGGLAATGALVLESWVLFGVTAGSYAVAVILDMWRPVFWKEVGVDLRRRGPSLPEPREVLDEDARSFARRLHKAREERERTLLGAPERYRRSEQVAKVAMAAVEVERRATALIASFERLAQYLSDKNLAKCRLQLEQAAACNAEGHRRREREGDADRELAYRATEEAVVALEALIAHKEAIAARLAALVQGLEMLPHRMLLVAMRDEDARTAPGSSPLLELDAELRSLEELSGVEEPLPIDRPIPSAATPVA